MVDVGWAPTTCDSVLVEVHVGQKGGGDYHDLTSDVQAGGGTAHNKSTDGMHKCRPILGLKIDTGSVHSEDERHTVFLGLSVHFHIGALTSQSSSGVRMYACYMNVHTRGHSFDQTTTNKVRKRTMTQVNSRVSHMKKFCRQMIHTTAIYTLHVPVRCTMSSKLRLVLGLVHAQVPIPVLLAIRTA